MSIHRWRQTDCLSITKNYYKNGFNFFKPEVHNQYGDNLTTGYTVGECPIYYYFIALLYKLFGPHEYIFRIVNLILLFVGLFYLFKLTQLFIKDIFYAFFIPYIIFTSTALVYYGNNYLTDPIAFAFSIIALYHFFKSSIQLSKLSLTLFFIFITMAALLKITAAISVIALISVYIISLIFSNFFNNKTYFPLGKLRYLIGSLFFILIVAGWYFFAISYKKEHLSTGYFSTRTYPIWIYNIKEITEWLNHIVKYQFAKAFNLSTHLLILTGFIFLIISYKKTKSIELAFVVLLTIGSILFFILWFFAFVRHDYYFINLLIVPVFILIFSVRLFIKIFPIISNNRYVKLFLLLFLFFNIYKTNRSIYDRYYSFPSFHLTNDYSYKIIKPYLLGIGIQEDDKIISLPDDIPSYSLYLMDMKGWTWFNKETQDSTGITTLIDKGAKYLIYQGSLKDYHSFLKPFMKKQIGQFFNLSIYNLQNDSIFYNPFVPKYDTLVFCNFEMTDSYEKGFLTSNKKVLISGLDQISNEYVFSGRNSIKVDSSKQFGIKTVISNVKQGDFYEVKIKRFQNNPYASLVVCDKDANRFYIKNNKGTMVKDKQGWESITIEFFVQQPFSKNEFTVYVWNRFNSPAYFDDMEIKKISFKL